MAQKTDVWIVPDVWNGWLCGLAETVWIMGIGDHAWVQGMDLGLTA